jgi:protein-S-isoprenylcysteine O-methyltransferase Ste14
MQEKNGEHPFGDAGQLIALVVFLVVWAGDSFFLKKSIFPSVPIPLLIRLFIAGIAFITAVLLARSGHVVVRHDQRPNHVVSTGAFRFVRHPLYAASLLIYIGFAVSTASLLSFVLFVGIFLFYNYIAGYEERLLRTKYGAAYTEYVTRTGRWLPRIG